MSWPLSVLAASPGPVPVCWCCDSWSWMLRSSE
uniref:Uncharacterized protein n=1 Tax=Anguilla anguilla TaxID=7936 RepID=A0A0E9SYA2_ANGAN